jgi:ribonuclease VapC
VFLDSSALVALLALEDDAAELASRMKRHGDRTTSPHVVWEAAISLSRKLSIPVDTSKERVLAYLQDRRIEILAVPPEAGAKAVEAWARYGKGVHPANLNFGDCLSYAMAKLTGAPMLYKGADFALTDIRPA